MIKGILIALLFIFASLGICEFFHDIRSCFLSEKSDNSRFLIIMLKKGTAIDQLRFSYEQYLWNGTRYADCIVAVNSDLDEAEYLNCLEYARNRDIVIAPKEMAGRIVGEISSV